MSEKKGEYYNKLLRAGQARIDSGIRAVQGKDMGRPLSEVMPLSSPDQDPNITTRRFPRIVNGKRVRQPVVTQAVMPLGTRQEESVTEQIMSTNSGRRDLKITQPVERKLIRDDQGKVDIRDDEVARRQRYAISRHKKPRK